MSLNLDIEKFKKEMEKEANKNYIKGRDAILLGYSEVVNGSPVDKGLYKNNHFITVNNSTNKTTKKEDKDSSSVISKNAPKINSLKFKDGDTITFQNNLSYAPKLEAVGGLVQPAGNYGRAGQKVKEFVRSLKWVQK